MAFTNLLNWLNGYQKRYGFVYFNHDEDSEKNYCVLKKTVSIGIEMLQR